MRDLFRIYMNKRVPISQHVYQAQAQAPQHRMQYVSTLRTGLHWLSAL